MFYIEVSPVTEGLKVRCDRCGWFTLYRILPDTSTSLEQVQSDSMKHNIDAHTTMAMSETRRHG